VLLALVLLFRLELADWCLDQSENLDDHRHHEALEVGQVVVVGLECLKFESDE